MVKGLKHVINNKISFYENLSNKINIGNKILGLIQRTFIHLDAYLFQGIHTAIVRSHLEFARQIWCPYLFFFIVKDTEAIENIQRWATWLVPEVQGLDYGDQLKKLKLPTPSYQRTCRDMIETFKTAKKCMPQIAWLISLQEDDHTRGNSCKLYKKRARFNTRKYSFSNRVDDMWVVVH